MTVSNESDQALYRSLSSPLLNWSLSIAGIIIIGIGFTFMQLEFYVPANGYLYQQGEHYL